MLDLSKAYTGYGGFNREFYFTASFNAIPSNIDLKLSLNKEKRSKKSFERVLSFIDLEKFNLEIICKSWNISSYKDTEKSEDYPYEYLLKSKTNILLLWVTLYPSELVADFYYEANDSIVEDWILKTINNLRNNLGQLETPSFEILAQNRDGFYAQEVNTKDFGALDISLMYNDDFQEIDQIITDSIKKSKSGLILLHGEPGTGKTTYIKNLISSFKSNSFIFIQNDLVPDLLKPNFISFLLRNKDCILIIEDAEKVVMSRETQDSSVVSTILQLTDGLFSDYLNIKVICSFNTGLDKIDKALLRKGRMIARYEFEKLTIEKSNKLLKSLGYEEMNQKMSVAEIYKLEDKNFSDINQKKIGFR